MIKDCPRVQVEGVQGILKKNNMKQFVLAKSRGSLVRFKEQIGRTSSVLPRS